MKKIFLSLLVIVSFSICAFSNDLLTIANNIDKPKELIFIAQFTNDVDTVMFNTGTNKISVNDRILSPSPFQNATITLTAGVYFWTWNYKIIEFYINRNDWRESLLTMQWSVQNLANSEKTYFSNQLVFFNSKGGNLHINNGSINYCINRPISDDKLSVKVIVANDTKAAVKVAPFNTINNSFEVKFPSGREFKVPITTADAELDLQSGDNAIYEIDFEKLLKESKDFSMDDFNYGLSELIWEIKQPDGQIITRNFYLIKFNGELPDDNGNGYKLNGDLNDPATFRDKKISVLPPAKVEQDKSTSVADEKPSPNSKTLKKDEE